ncbi:hypothetical protein [Petroclostridium xylanilyticum]|uniref:hypothetical protein n=1 Tax=Petroclostridium xylanilyticum TaxID=1792311 RepID=UPI000B997991|nr:hypothetical protein [Petroclostridium xylanilyticum]
MKQISICVIFISIIIILTSCNSKVANYNQSLSYMELIEFDKYNSLITLNDDIDPNSYESILFYGKINSSQAIEEIEEDIKQELKSISLIQNEEIIMESDNFIWNINDSDNIKNFELQVNILPNKIDTNVYIDKLQLNLNTDKKITKEIGMYYINTHNMANNKILSVVESPIEPHKLPVIGKESTVSYRIMTLTENFNNNFKVTVDVPEFFTKFFSITSVKWNYDDKLTEDIKKEYKKSITEAEIKNVKIYEVIVTYKVNEKSNILFKPLIFSDITNSNEFCTPSVPLKFHYTD